MPAGEWNRGILDDIAGIRMKVILRNPRREVAVAGNRRVKDILRELDILPETVLVICGDDLVTADHVVRDDATIELRPVMSGGRGPDPR